MELYNTIIRGVEGLAGSSAPRRFAYDPADAWEDPGCFELVMLRDAAFELGGGSKAEVYQAESDSLLSRLTRSVKNGVGALVEYFR